MTDKLLIFTIALSSVFAFNKLCIEIPIKEIEFELATDRK